jgi:hypothetical protein
MSTGKVKCPRCGGIDFEGLFSTFDQVTYQCSVYEDGTYDTICSLKEFVGDMELASNDFRCLNCNHEICINNLPKQPKQPSCETIWDEN